MHEFISKALQRDALAKAARARQAHPLSDDEWWYMLVWAMWLGTCLGLAVVLSVVTR